MAYHVPIMWYHRYAWVNYNKVGLIFTALKPFFSNIILVFFSKFKVSHHDRTKYGSVSHIYLCLLPLSSLTPTPIPLQKQGKLLFYILKTNQYILSRLMIHVSFLTIMYVLTVYFI